MEAKGTCLCKQENACGGLFQNHRQLQGENYLRQGLRSFKYTTVRLRNPLLYVRYVSSSRSSRSIRSTPRDLGYHSSSHGSTGSILDRACINQLASSYRRVTVQARTVGAPGPKQPSLHRRRPCRCGSCATSRTSKPLPPKCKQYHQHPIYINNIVRNKASNDKDFILLTIYLDQLASLKKKAYP